MALAHQPFPFPQAILRRQALGRQVNASRNDRNALATHVAVSSQLVRRVLRQGDDPRRALHRFAEQRRKLPLEFGRRVVAPREREDVEDCDNFPSKAEGRGTLRQAVEQLHLPGQPERQVFLEEPVGKPGSARPVRALRPQKLTSPAES